MKLASSRPRAAFGRFIGGHCCAAFYPSLPATSRTATTSTVFPPLGTVDLGGWMFLNLSRGSIHVTSGGLVSDEKLSAQRAGFGPNAPGTAGSRTTTQNWVSSSMYGAGTKRLSVEFAAAWFGNGCTRADPAGATIAPATQRAGPLVCPSATASSDCGAGTLPPGVNP